MRGENTFPIPTKAGIKRDGTLFEGDYYTDGEGVRFQKGMPRKILGWRNMTSNALGIQRGCHLFSQNTSSYVHGGSSDYLQRFIFDSSGAMTGIAGRTPTGFIADAQNMWTFDTIFDAGGSSTALIAHAAPNLSGIANDTGRLVYYGDATGAMPLTPITGSEVSGGAVVLHPYVFIYGSNGYIGWSQPNVPTNLTGLGSGNARITGSKIVKGLSYRGGPANSPAGLFWSLDALIRVSFVGGDSIFRSDELAEISILAQNSVIQYDGLYFWIAEGRFMMFNGTIREVPNNMNIDWFFSNLNYAHRQKIWAIKIPRMGEIWWIFPKGTSTECNHAIIFNIREGTWYDTPWERSCGYASQVFPYPVMFQSFVNEAGNSKLWQHEYGYDIVDGADTTAIKSYFETSDISFAATGPTGQWTGKDAWVSFDRLEPDFVQVGEMTMQMKGRQFANSPTTEGAIHTFSPTTEKIDYREQYRQARFRFESNTLGGYYEMGQVIIHPDEGDKRS